MRCDGSCLAAAPEVLMKIAQLSARIGTGYASYQNREQHPHPHPHPRAANCMFLN